MKRDLWHRMGGSGVGFILATAALAAIVFLAPPGNRILTYLALVLCAVVLLLIRQLLLKALRERTEPNHSEPEDQR